MNEVVRCAVIGNPIAHSLSPRVHQLFAEQTGIKLIYTKELVETANFTSVVDKFKHAGFRGLNVTAPFKAQAYQYADHHDAAATQARAVNTLTFKNGVTYGSNTDGQGLVTDLVTTQQVPLSRQRILLLGAGGAARGILGPLLSAQPQVLHVANRTLATAQQLVADFQQLIPTTQLSCGNLQDLGSNYDLIINATSSPSFSYQLPLTPATICYDLSYTPTPTTFSRYAEQQGVARIISGLGMLLEQAASAFELWHGVRPVTQGLNL